MPSGELDIAAQDFNRSLERHGINLIVEKIEFEPELLEDPRSSGRLRPRLPVRRAAICPVRLTPSQPPHAVASLAPSARSARERSNDDRFAACHPRRFDAGRRLRRVYPGHLGRHPRRPSALPRCVRCTRPVEGCRKIGGNAVQCAWPCATGYPDVGRFRLVGRALRCGRFLGRGDLAGAPDAFGPVARRPWPALLFDGRASRPAFIGRSRHRPRPVDQGRGFYRQHWPVSHRGDIGRLRSRPGRRGSAHHWGDAWRA